MGMFDPDDNPELTPEQIKAEADAFRGYLAHLAASLKMTTDLSRQSNGACHFCGGKAAHTSKCVMVQR